MFSSSTQVRQVRFGNYRIFCGFDKNYLLYGEGGRTKLRAFQGLLATVNPINLLLTSIGILLTGHGLQLSLLPLHARSLGWSAQEIGQTGAVYFAGFVVGCLTVPLMLNRAGSIRVIICSSAMAAAVLMLLETSESILLWCALRFITGWSLAAIYATAEGWLNDHVEDQRRGRLLSIYVIVTLVGIGAGQLLLGFVPHDDLFRAGALLMLLAIFPVGLFCEESQIHTKRVRLRLHMFRKVPALASLGVFLGGIVTGSIWTLGPLIGESRGFSLAEIGWMMNAMIVGGVLLQFPLGMLSDQGHRNRAILFATLLGLACCGLIPFISHDRVLLFNLAMTLFGGTTLTLYALFASIGQQATLLTRVETASILLLFNGIGSILGPILTGMLGSYVANAVFVISGLALLSLAIAAMLIPESKQATVLKFEPSVAEPHNFKKAA